jgi:hypothetical protein
MNALRKLEDNYIWVVPGFFCVVWLVTGWWGRPIGDYGVETDFYGDFVVYARQWLSGHPTIMNGFRGPFYYLLIGVLEKFLGDAFTIAKVLSALTAAVSLVLVGKLLDRLWGRVVALSGVLFVVANPAFVRYTFRACTDMVYLLLFVATLYLLLGATNRYRNWMLAGACAAFALLTRYNGFGLVPSALVIALVTIRPLSLAVRRFAVFIAIWFVLVVPWFGFLWKETGNPLWSNAFQNIAIDVFTSHPGLATNGQFMSKIGFNSVAEVIRVDPVRFVGALGRNSMTHVWMDIRELIGIPWALAALAGFVMGLVLWRRSRKAGKPAGEGRSTTILHRKRLAFVLVAIVVYCSFIPVFYNSRFMLSLLPFWALGIGLLVEGLVGYGKRVGTTAKGEKPSAKNAGRSKRARSGGFLGRRVLGSRRRLLPGLLVALVGLAVWTHYREISKSTDPTTSMCSPVEILELADMAKQSGYPFGPDTPIAARKPQIAYYLDTPFLPIRIGTIDEVGQAGAQYMLVTTMEVSWAPSLRRLMLAQDVPEGMEIVAHVIEPIGGQYFRGGTLYKLPKSPLYEEPKPKKVMEETIPGLDRIDTLRLRIARWYHFFDTKQKSAGLLRAIKDQDHVEVLTTWGDLAFLEGNLDRAKDLYRRALPDTTGQFGLVPPGTNNYLRMAAVSFLENDGPAFSADLRDFFRLKGIALPVTTDLFWDIYASLESSGDRVASLGFVMGGYSGASNSPDMLRLYGKLLMLTGWHELARPLLESYLTVRPNDVEIIEMLETPPDRRL